MNFTLGRDDPFPLENFKKGVRVWIKDPEKVWISGELLNDITFASNSVQIFINSIDEVAPLNNFFKSISYDVVKNGLPFLCNPDILLGKDDLTSLSYLHEPAVLNNLRHRFEVLETIYTYSGIVLVAINPYTNCSHLYGEDVIMVYRGVGKQVRDLDPHIYAIAEEAYYDLCEYGKNQSVIISGESGAGKTVSAKFVMRYLANVASSICQNLTKNPVEKSERIEDRVLASNPIMEAIGNAKTIRNDNSSRFGKFIQINFSSQRFAMIGAQMKTYLLEKSRVVSQSECERNYHIFYQICASSNHPLLENLNLANVSNYHYTNMSGESKIDGVDDQEGFLETLKAFEMLKIFEKKQGEIFRILAGILFLGNIAFESQPGNNDRASITSESQPFVEKLCENLYEIEEKNLICWLTSREIRAGTDVVKKNFNVQEAIDNRDALSKTIYSCLFNWIVERINENLMQIEELKQNKRNSHLDAQKFIGVLDIYGFEAFENNSFEQFCINYANEKLQQQFNQHVFKLEQAEYEKEGISWIRIDFYDNQPIIDLIESRPGIIDYLDEQCKTGRGTDSDWLDQLNNCKVLKKNEHLQIPKIRNFSFIIRHFAADVSYKITNFIEKNKDTVNEQLLNTIGKTQFKFLREVLRDVLASSSTGVKRKKTVAIQFRDSLKELITVLNFTRPHYVRCIKPNDDKERFYFDPKRAIQQLRACGVLETVRISAAGFPSRWTYDDFARRYRVLFAEGRNLWRKNSKQFANSACLKWLDGDKFALGTTKIFLRTGQVALIERIRQQILSNSVVLIQKIWRGFVQRRKYRFIQQSLINIQAITKAFLAYKRIKYLQMQRASIIIQSAVRGHQCKLKYNQIRLTVLTIQSHFRASLVRKRVLLLKYEKAVLSIQKWFRDRVIRRENSERLRKIIKIQCCVRRWLAKRRFRELKIAAREVNFLQNLNKGLENKIISLQQKVDLLANERRHLAEQCAESEAMKAQLLGLQAKFGILSVVRNDAKLLRKSLIELSAGVLNQSNVFFQDFIAQYRQLASNMVEKTNANLSELENKEKEIFNLKEKILEQEKVAKKLAEQNELEIHQRKRVERDLEQMRDQLFQNAALLASPEFSRAGSIRQDIDNIDFRTTPLSPLGDCVATHEFSSYILLKQQKMVNDMRQKSEEKDRIISRLQLICAANEADRNSKKCTAIDVYETQKIQDLELTVNRYKSELQRILDGCKYGPESLLSVEKIKEENERLRDESVEIRALLANHFERQIHHQQEDSGCGSGTQSDDGSNTSIVNTEMDERIAQERLLRKYKQLLDIASRELSDRDELILGLESRLTLLSSETNSQASTCTSGTAPNPFDNFPQNAAILENLIQENLSLQHSLSRKSEEVAETRAHLRGYSGFTLDDSNPIPDPYAENTHEVLRLDSLRVNSGFHSGLLEIFNVPEFTRILIYDLKPRLAKRLIPCLPAYLLLLGFRFYDKTCDDAGLTGLFNAVHTILRDNSMNSTDTDILALWLVNSWRLLNLLRQYSSEMNLEWNKENTELQNNQCIKNFNLEPIRNQLKLRVEVFYSNLMKRSVEPLLIPKIVPGILQHESYDFITAPSSNDVNIKESGRRSLADLIEFLNFVHLKLKGYGADGILIEQVFRQIAHWICALALNHMMFRKELCTPEKAISIKHNVTEIKCWLTENKIGESAQPIGDIFEPLIQASHLLQLRKSHSNLDLLCGETTSRLKPKQILAILRHFTPSDGFFEEDVIDEDFLNKISQKLNERISLQNLNGNFEKDELLMRGTYLDPFNTEPFLYSEFPIETLTLPACLNFQSVSRLI